MIKRFFLVGLVFCLPFLLFSETVLLYTMTKSSIDDSNQSAYLIEDGVMNEFFDAGHIVYNAVGSESVADVGLAHYKESASMQMAKSGGASFLLEVELVYTELQMLNLPTYVEFQFIEVATGNLIKEGSVNIDKKYIYEGYLEKGITDMGTRIAGFVLVFL